MSKGRLLTVEDDASTRLGVRMYLETYGYEIDEVDTVAAALQKLKQEVADLVLLDFRLPDGTALDLLRQLRLERIEVPVIVLTGHGSIDLAVTTIKEGAEQFLTKPIDLASLATVVDRIIDNAQNTRRAQAAHARPGASDAMFGGPSAIVRGLAIDARVAAECDGPILIEGETGTGKGVLARWIHNASQRASESFVDLNCAGLPRDLLESELFGHERGAFTGATSAKPGLIEAAHRGTMFLDEIGDTDLAVQPKLLKVVEEKRVRRLGSVSERRIDVRFIAATNKSLSSLVQERLFREDLYYRLDLLVLRLPPLRCRKDDIPHLTATLLQQLTREIRRPGMHLEPDAEAALLEHSWPGNVRELRNVLERAMLLASSSTIRRRDLRLEPPTGQPTYASSGRMLEENAWRLIERVLQEEGGNVRRSAGRLGIPRSTLYQKLKDQNPQRRAV